MKFLSCLLLAISLHFFPAIAEDEPVDDAAIRKTFLEQAQSLRKNEVGMRASDLRKELRKEKRGVPDLVLPEPSSLTLLPKGQYDHGKSTTLIVGHIYHDDSHDNWRTNLAGGVVITPEGMAVTNFHVLDFDRAAHFAAMDEAGILYPIVAVLASDQKADLAIIQLETQTEWKAAPLAVDASVGDFISVISHPDAHFFSYTSGRISRFSIDPRSRARRIEITAPFARGSSGCAIYDRHGNVVGIVSATNAIYYEEDYRARRNLQMVIHSGVPTSSLRKLLSGE